MSFRGNFSDFNKNLVNDFFGLIQGKKLREGYSGPGNMETTFQSNAQSFWNSYGPSNPQYTQDGVVSGPAIDLKISTDSTATGSWNVWANNAIGQNGQQRKKMQKYAYNAYVYSQHYSKLNEALKQCREECNVNNNDAKDKSACKAGCTVAFPRYANPSDTFVMQAACSDNDESTRCDYNSPQSCGSITNAVCDNNKVVNPNSDVLQQIGEDGYTSIQSGCRKCGGGLVGKPRYNARDVMDGSEDYFITDKASINNGIHSATGGSGKDCTNLGARQSACDGGINIMVTKMGNNITPNNESLLTGAAGEGVTSEIIGNPGENGDTWRQNEGTATMSLSQRYKAMKDSYTEWSSRHESDNTVMQKLDDYISKVTQDINSADDTTSGNLANLKLRVTDFLKNMSKFDTEMGRAEDSMLKMESQNYRNWALGVLAISLFTVALYKVKTRI